MKKYGKSEKITRENGSYTIEACISLFAFLITIYVVFLQINTMVAESVLQKAVDNVAVEISSYSYILKRIGIIPEHSDDEMSTTQNAIDSGKQLYTNFNGIAGNVSEFVSGLFENPKGGAEDISNLGASLGAFVDALKSVNWKDELSSAARFTIETGVKKLVSEKFSEHYTNRVQQGMYLPTAYENFKSVYRADNLKISVKFMPDTGNDTVLVYATCEIKTPIDLFGFDKRVITKVAYSPLWVR